MTSTARARDDNGSGSAAILETALMIAKVKPVNSLRFAWLGR
jgi:Zn-dependent M28 family amino/carboxypeptidase